MKFFSAAASAAGLLLIASLPQVLRGQAPTARVPFTQAQATEGGRVYVRKCASCHGARLDDGAAPPLTGAKFLETWTAPDRTLDDLFFIIRSTMPKNEGGTLATSEYLAVLAHMLERNGYAASDRELTADANVLEAVRLTPPPREAADKKDPAPDFIAGTGSTTPRASGPKHEELVAAVGIPQRIKANPCVGSA
jgi:mono/diheme cytochrome c family protein